MTILIFVIVFLKALSEEISTPSTQDLDLEIPENLDTVDRQLFRVLAGINVFIINFFEKRSKLIRTQLWEKTSLSYHGQAKVSNFCRSV